MNVVSKKKEYGRKSRDHSTDNEEKPTKVYEERLSVINGLGKPIPDYFIEEIRVDLHEWYQKPTSLRFKDFLRERRISWKVFCDLRDRYAPLAQEDEWALDAIASHREIGAMTRKFDPASAFKMISLYDPDYIKVLQQEAEIKKIAQGEATGDTKIVVMMPEIGHSPLVPERKRDDD